VGAFRPEPAAATAAVLAAAGAPATGRLAAAALLVTGEHRKVLVWRRQGSMISLHGRMRIGTTSLFLNGFRAAAPGLSALGELATLKAGDFLGCWGRGLRDTDRFWPVPKRWLLHVEDREAIALGTAEAADYANVLGMANYTSRKAFQKAVRGDLTYANLMNDPEECRGKVVHARGILKRVTRYAPPFEASSDWFVNDLYEAWVLDEKMGGVGYCVVFTEWSPGLPRSLLGQKEITRHIVVSLDGYFFKKFRYSGVNRKGARSTNEVPLLIGHGLNVISVAEAPPAQSSGDEWASSLGTILCLVIGSVVVAVAGLTWWFRRTDRRVRDRLFLARNGEFVLPPPDANPVAPPVGPPGRRTNTFARPALPPAPGRPAERPGPAHAPDEGAKGGKAGPGAPDEGAGA
jgi:hypothetical protein